MPTEAEWAELAEADAVRGLLIAAGARLALEEGIDPSQLQTSQLIGKATKWFNDNWTILKEKICKNPQVQKYYKGGHFKDLAKIIANIAGGIWVHGVPVGSGTDVLACGGLKLLCGKGWPPTSTP